MVWDPWEEMEKMHRKIDEMFKKLTTVRMTAKFPEARIPVSDVYETENNVIAVFEMPGIEKKDINLKITEDRIEVKAMRKVKKEEKRKEAYRYEAMARSYYKAVSLPALVKPEEAKAEYKKGILRIEIPKKKKAEKKVVKKIKVK